MHEGKYYLSEEIDRLLSAGYADLESKQRINNYVQAMCEWERESTSQKLTIVRAAWDELRDTNEQLLANDLWHASDWTHRNSRTAQSGPRHKFTRTGI